MTEGTTVSDMGKLSGVSVSVEEEAALTTSARKQMTIYGRDFFPPFVLLLVLSYFIEIG